MWGASQWWSVDPWALPALPANQVVAEGRSAGEALEELEAGDDDTGGACCSACAAREAGEGDAPCCGSSSPSSSSGASFILGERTAGDPLDDILRDRDSGLSTDQRLQLAREERARQDRILQEEGAARRELTRQEWDRADRREREQIAREIARDNRLSEEQTRNLVAGMVNRGFDSLVTYLNNRRDINIAEIQANRDVEIARVNANARGETAIIEWARAQQAQAQNQAQQPRTSNTSALVALPLVYFGLRALGGM